MNIVLIIAWILAAVSSFAVLPDAEYLNYIDFHTLGLLFADGSDGRPESGRSIWSGGRKIARACEKQPSDGTDPCFSVLSF